MVRLGMQVAFGQVRRKTGATGGESVCLFLGFTINYTIFNIMSIQQFQFQVDS